MTNKPELSDQPDIRRIYDEETERWYFAVVDVIGVLTEAPEPRKYWYDMKRRGDGGQLSAICRQFKLVATNGRKYNTECADQEGILRIIQSVPSPKAEPIKLWLAEVGRERIEEYEDPAKAVERAQEYYRKMGRSEEWIKSRLESQVIRNELTDEWKARGVEEGKEFAILTAIIHRGAFDISPKDHKDLKGLKRQNLRDHMTPIELALTMLGEASTTEIARSRDAQGFQENKGAADAGGRIAGNARKQIEQETGRSAVSSENFLESGKKGKGIEEGKN